MSMITVLKPHTIPFLPLTQLLERHKVGYRRYDVAYR